MTDLTKLTAEELRKRCEYYQPIYTESKMFDEIRRRLEQLEEREQQWLTQRVAIDAMVLQAGHPSQFGVEFRLIVDYLLERLEKCEGQVKYLTLCLEGARNRIDDDTETINRQSKELGRLEQCEAALRPKGDEVFRAFDRSCTEANQCRECGVSIGGQHKPSCHRQGLVTQESTL